MSPPAAPRIRTRLPGPKARRWLARDRRVISPSYTRTYPLVAEKGRGAVVEDVDGNRFLDCAAGIAVVATGHAHPDVVRAVREQAGRLLHMSGTDFYYRRQVEVSEALAAIAPGRHRKRVFLCNSGTEAIEAAMKLARHKTGRSRFLAFHGAFHGRTLGALSLTCSKSIHRARFGPFVPGVTHVPYPDPYRPPLGETAETVGRACLDFIEREVFGRIAPPDEFAAVVIEPIQGEGGYVVPPDGFLRDLARLARRHGILLIADEVQSGMGRTGKMFACDHEGVTPDILCLAKGIASGMPLGAIVARATVMDWPPGAHASTFGGNPVACAAALETIRLLRGGLVSNARKVGAFLRRALEKATADHPAVGTLRGRGLMLGVEIVSDRGGKTPDPARVARIVEGCFRRGLLVLPCGRSAVRFSPPLILTEREAALAVAIFQEALARS